MRTRLGPLFLLTVCLTLANCTDSSESSRSDDDAGDTPNDAGQDPTPDAGPDTTGDASAPDDDVSTPGSNPRDVELTLDSARKVSAVISPEGGALSASGADGTSYELSVPAGAILSDATISITPIASMTGVALGDSYAVHLEPEGLEFLEPVTLTMRTTSLADRQVVAFNSHELGRDFYLQPHTVTDDAVVLTLQHFSNPGAALLEPDADLSDLVVELVPSDPRDQFEHELALDLREEVSQAQALTRKYYGKVRDKLEAGASDPSVLKDAIRGFLTFRKEVARLGLDEVFKKEIFESWRLIAEGIDTAIQRAHATCSVNATFSDFVDILGWITWIKQNPRLSPYFEGKLAEYEALAQGCASFELAFDYTQNERAVTGGGGDQSSDLQASLHLSTKLEVSYSFEWGMLVGEAPMVVESFTASGYASKPANLPPSCPNIQPGEVMLYSPFTVGAGPNGKSQIPLLSLLVDADDPNAPATEIEALTLFMFPSATVETFNADCDEFDLVNGNIANYVPAFLGLFGFLNDWTYDVGDLSWWRVPFEFAGDTAEYSRDHDYQGPDPVFAHEDTTLTVTGSTHMTLRHTPK